MQNTIQVFESSEFGQVRTIVIDGQPWLIGKDVAEALSYQNTRDALRVHVDDEDKADVVIHDGRQKRKMISINESGLYSLILSSKLPTAKAFKRWVTSEVLPSIRKFGAYINDDVMSRMQEDSEYTADLLRNLTAERNRNNALANKVALLATKAHYHDIILQCKDAIPITLIAKDYGMSAVTFNKMLHGMKIQHRIGGVWVLYKDYQSFGYTKTNTYTKNGITTRMHTCWTQRGRLWLYEMLKARGILPTIEKMADGVQMSLADADVC